MLTGHATPTAVQQIAYLLFNSVIANNIWNSVVANSSSNIAPAPAAAAASIVLALDFLIENSWIKVYEFLSNR